MSGDVISREFEGLLDLGVGEVTGSWQWSAPIECSNYSGLVLYLQLVLGAADDVEISIETSFDKVVWHEPSIPYLDFSTAASALRWTLTGDTSERYVIPLFDKYVRVGIIGNGLDPSTTTVLISALLGQGGSSLSSYFKEINAALGLDINLISSSIDSISAWPAAVALTGTYQTTPSMDISNSNRVTVCQSLLTGAVDAVNTWALEYQIEVQVGGLWFYVNAYGVAAGVVTNTRATYKPNGGVAYTTGATTYRDIIADFITAPGWTAIRVSVKESSVPLPTNAGMIQILVGARA